MTLYYVNNACSAKPPAGDRHNGQGAGDIHAGDLPVTDASSYVSGVLPLADSAFIVSRMWENRSIMALDFRDSASMNAALGRINYFLESADPNGQQRVPEANSKLFPTGSFSLRISDVASFFTYCRAQSIFLKEQEQSFLDEIVRLGLVAENDNAITASSDGVLIGMSRDTLRETASGNDEDAVARAIRERQQIFVHEYSHGLYFLDPVFRGEVDAAWESLGAPVREMMTGALVLNDYSPSRPWLIKTEAQAYSIEDPEGCAGSLGILVESSLGCQKAQGSDALRRSCSEFRASLHDFEGKLWALHDSFMRVSACKIPLLSSSWSISDGYIMDEGNPSECHERSECAFTAADKTVCRDFYIKAVRKFSEQGK